MEAVLKSRALDYRSSLLIRRIENALDHPRLYHHDLTSAAITELRKNAVLAEKIGESPHKARAMSAKLRKTVETAESSLAERTAEDDERKIVQEVERLLDLHKRQVADGHSMVFADRHLNEAKTHVAELEACVLFRGKAARLIEEILRLDDTRGTKMRPWSAPARDRREAPVITRTTKKPEAREGVLYGRKTELA